MSCYDTVALFLQGLKLSLVRLLAEEVLPLEQL